MHAGKGRRRVDQPFKRRARQKSSGVHTQLFVLDFKTFKPLHSQSSRICQRRYFTSRSGPVMLREHVDGTAPAAFSFLHCYANT